MKVDYERLNKAWSQLPYARDRCCGYTFSMHYLLCQLVIDSAAMADRGIINIPVFVSASFLRHQMHDVATLLKELDSRKKATLTTGPNNFIKVYDKKNWVKRQLDRVFKVQPKPTHYIRFYPLASIEKLRRLGDLPNITRPFIDHHTWCSASPEWKEEVDERLGKFIWKPKDLENFYVQLQTSQP